MTGILVGWTGTRVVVLTPSDGRERVDVEVVEVGRPKHAAPAMAHGLPGATYSSPESGVSDGRRLVSNSKVNRQSRAEDVPRTGRRWIEEILKFLRAMS